MRERHNRMMRVFLMMTMLGLMAACAPGGGGSTEETEGALNLIPQPVSLTRVAGSFELTEETVIVVTPGDHELSRIGQLLADVVRPSTGFAVPVKEAGTSVETGTISLALIGDDPELGEEGYELSVSEDGITVAAARPAGVYRGIQTLRQISPTKLERTTPQQGPWRIPAVKVRDYPRFAYRGVMLDVSRHFFPVDTVKRYIDLIAAYKLNALHLHLSDDQGWRIEIKSWPNLTEHGSKSEVGEGEGGFFTQEDYRELVRYAQERFVVIIPEIDVPGHTNAALASYPELNCDGKAPELYRGIEVGFSTLCTDKEITYKFLDDVIRELAEITPGPYIHIGGDESLSTPMEDYIPFVERVQKIVESHGKKVLGWDEIANTKLLPDSVIQYWKFAENASMGLEQGAKLIMSPADRAYLDMQYDETSPLGQHWAAYIEIDRSYQWDPEALVEGATKEHILGIEMPLWTETIKDIEDIEFMAFPRLPGLAEIGWSPAAGRSWEEYKVRLGNHAMRMNAMEINFYRSALVPWSDAERSAE